MAEPTMRYEICWGDSGPEIVPTASQRFSHDTPAAVIASALYGTRRAIKYYRHNYDNEYYHSNLKKFLGQEAALEALEQRMLSDGL